MTNITKNTVRELIEMRNIGNKQEALWLGRVLGNHTFIPTQYTHMFTIEKLQVVFILL